MQGKLRSDETKERISRAARRLFAEHGYERTTIRAVASEARIDPSMVMRYFGNKEGLFASVAEFDLNLPDLADVPPDEVGARLVSHFLATWQDRQEDGLIVLLRAASSNEEARNRMRDIFRAQVLPMVASVVEDEAEAEIRAALIASQMIGLAFCRFVVRLPILAGDDPEPIIEGISPVIQMHLYGGQETGTH